MRSGRSSAEDAAQNKVCSRARSSRQLPFLHFFAELPLFMPVCAFEKCNPGSSALGHASRRTTPSQPARRACQIRREHLEQRKWCKVFENRLKLCWPAEKSAADITREKEIREFAKANGWIAEIHYPGLGVVFKKVTAQYLYGFLKSPVCTCVSIRLPLTS